MLRFLIALVAITLAIYALADLFGTKERDVRGVPKLLWVMVIVFIPVLGPFAWIIVSRSTQPGRGAPSRMRPIAPDEDPEFLAMLDRQIRDERRRRLTRESAPQDKARDTPPNAPDAQSEGTATTPATGEVHSPEREPTQPHSHGVEPGEHSVEQPEFLDTGDIDDPESDDGARK